MSNEVVNLTDEVCKSSPSTWQTEMQEAVRDPVELCRLLDLPPDLAKNAVGATTQFPLFVPRPFLTRIRPADPNDPLLLQVLPTQQELQLDPLSVQDPLEELKVAEGTGFIQKYEGRVLTILTGTCPVHCRYCFRRHFPYAEHRGLTGWPELLNRVREDERVREVILSGGDPLTVNDEIFARLLDELSDVSHLKRIRIHSRFPITIPNRITTSLVDALRACRLKAVMVIHANHPNELDTAVCQSIERMLRAGILVLNQSVLLKGVNDSALILAELSERLIDAGVIPYYLHQLDRVTGAMHFEVTEERGREIIQTLRHRLPGYAVPRYVREEPGEPAKTVLM